jgi:tryptophanase
VYIDTDGFFNDEDGTKRGEFYGISLVAILLCFGHRLCELGAFAFSGPTAPCETPQDVPSNFVRAAIPRNLYSSDDLNALALLLAYLREDMGRIVGVVPLDDCRKLSLHHFKSVFEFKLE